MAILGGVQHQNTDGDPAEDLMPRGTAPVAIMLRAIGARRGYRYCAKTSTNAWAGVVASPNVQTALFDAVTEIRAADPSLTHLQIVVSTRVMWAARSHFRELQDALNVTLISGADGNVKPLLAEAFQMLDVITPPPSSDIGKALKVRKAALPETFLPPVTVATDGSVRGNAIGCGWLACNGAYGLRGFRHSNRMHGGSKVLISELRGIDEALRRLGRHERITVLTDCQAAIAMVKAWQNGAETMPRGYITERGEGEEARLASACRRVHRLRDRLEIHWVRSHCGEPLNEGADALARLASRYVRGGSGLSAQEYRSRASELAEAFANAFCTASSAA